MGANSSLNLERVVLNRSQLRCRLQGTYPANQTRTSRDQASQRERRWNAQSPTARRLSRTNLAFYSQLAPVLAMTINSSVVRRSRVNRSRVRHRASGFRARFQTVSRYHLALARLFNRGSTLLQINA
jgi:hypothetical protein